MAHTTIKTNVDDIFRNAQSAFNNWFPIYEVIQNDASSIYLTDGQTIPILLGSNNFDSFGVDATPQISTTALIQEVPVSDPNRSNVALDNVDVTFDTVNQEPDIENDVAKEIKDSSTGTPRSGIFNSETNVKEQIKENKQIEEQELRNRDGEITRQAQNRELSSRNRN